MRKNQNMRDKVDWADAVLSIVFYIGFLVIGTFTVLTLFSR